MGRRVLITGVSSGIGLATARLLAESGYDVAGTLREGSTPPEKAGRLALVTMDVDSDDSVARGVREAVDRLGGIDVLINNAGISHLGPFEQTPPPDGRRILETNLWGTIRVCREVVPLMRERKSGTILNVGSMAGRIGVPFQSFYAASKWAVKGFSESLRMELTPLGIKVVVVDPGDFKTAIGPKRRVVPDVQPDYRPFFEKVRRQVEKTETAEPPEVVARLILKILAKPRLRSAYVAGKGMTATAWFLKLAPGFVRERSFCRYYGITRPRR